MKKKDIKRKRNKKINKMKPEELAVARNKECGYSKRYKHIAARMNIYLNKK